MKVAIQNRMSSVWHREPGRGKYARIEREQRFLIERLPSGVRDPRSVEDLYLAETRLRLRRISDGHDVVFKLAQKVRLDEDDPSVVTITNIYLDPGEYDRLVHLSGANLSKTRYTLRTPTAAFAVDEFRDELQGLLLAELELSPDATPLATPSFALADVSHDDRFSGGFLARVSQLQLRRMLATFGLSPH